LKKKKKRKMKGKQIGQPIAHNTRSMARPALVHVGIFLQCSFIGPDFAHLLPKQQDFLFFLDFTKIFISFQILQNYTITAIWYGVWAQTPYHTAAVNSTVLGTVALATIV
jgi:hypothetical protein